MSKTIVILGASRGIGAALVEQFAHSNHKVVALARNVDEMLSKFSSYPNVSCHAIDLESSNLKQEASDILSHFEKIDIVVNNAGTLVNKPFTELTEEDITKCYRINIVGIMLFTQTALPFMQEGHIVNISSIGGFQGSVKFPGLAAYSTSKAALCSFTELFAEEYKETKIKMNCLCLGAVQTEMLAQAFPGYEAPMSAEKMAEYIVDFSLKADQWMNGKIIPVSLSTP